MKTWNNAEIEELFISETATPGKGHHNGVSDNSGNHYGWGNGNKNPGDMTPQQPDVNTGDNFS